MQAVILLMLINSVRQTPLVVDKDLARIAEVRCADMSEWSHKGFPFQKVFDLGYNLAGENLALNFDSSEDAFKALQNSKLHKQNNEDKKYSKIGIAVCKNKVGTTTVFLFAGKI